MFCSILLLRLFIFSLITSANVSVFHVVKYDLCQILTFIIKKPGCNPGVELLNWGQGREFVTSTIWLLSVEEMLTQ